MKVMIVEDEYQQSELLKASLAREFSCEVEVISTESDFRDRFRAPVLPRRPLVAS